MKLSIFNKTSENMLIFYRKKYFTVTLKISISSDVHNRLQLKENVFHQNLLSYVF